MCRRRECRSRDLTAVTIAASWSERVRASPTSIIEFLGVSPDGQWVVAQVSVSDEKTPRGVVAYSVRDGSSRRVCYIPVP
jgi:hypothetical protein